MASVKTTHQLWLALIAVVALILLAVGIALPGVQPAAYAQRPTPTNIFPPLPEGGESDSEEPLHNGTVSGIVFNYSTSRPQGGIGVVLDGGGWVLETVSGADGHYIFRGLGSGPATLRLRLPEGATAVNPDLEVYTGHNLDVNANLGYYTGDQPPMPVLLTAEYALVEGDSAYLVLNLQVENRWTAEVTGVLVDARLPTGQQIISAQTSRGWADAVGLRALAHLGNLPQGQKADVRLQVRPASPEALGKKARAILTYDQQMTSQIVEVAAGGGAITMPVTGEVVAWNSPTGLWLVVLFAAAFGCAVVLGARLKNRR